MGCSSCGGSAVPANNYALDQAAHPWIDVNDYGVRPIGDEAINCQPYSGIFPGTTVFLVGYDEPDKVKIFLRDSRAEAWQYAQENGLAFQHINVTELCHDRVVSLLGA